MHVCHFCDTTFESDFFRNIVAGLTSRGVTVSLVELGPGPRPTWLGRFPGVEYLNLEAANKLQYPLAVQRLSRFLSRHDVDILHTHLFFAGIIGLLSKRLRPKTIVAVMRHHTGVVRMLGSRVHIAADKWMAEKADHVMTVSAAARAFMLETDGIRRDDIEVVYTGFNFEKLAANEDDRRRVRREFGFAADDFVIGYVANFIPGKGHIELITAFKALSGEMPNARLFLPGRGMLDKIADAAAGLAERKIVFAGWRDDIPACLNAMDLFIQPSLSEAFSQVLIEAMGVGLPVIATRVGGADEVIKNGINGILVAPGDVAALTREILRLHSDCELRSAIARQGLASVTQTYTVDRMIERLMGLYESWLAPKPTS